jgi:Ca-activated chloride channel homolog
VHRTARTQLSVIAAGFGEKLRGSYWVRTLSYNELLALWERLPSQQRERKEVQELADLIRRASLLDRRGDPFEHEAPLAKMDFDHLPVVR